MQPYKKNFKPYVILSIIFLYVGFVLGNGFYFLKGYDVSSKLFFLFNQSTEGVLSVKPIQLLYRPTISGLLCGLLFFLATFILYVKDNDRGVYRHGEEHGSARYARPTEIGRFGHVDLFQNILLTQHAKIALDNSSLPMEYHKNKNMIVLGGPGSGKTYTYIKPNIMQMNSSFIVTDPKGLLVRETGKMLEENGFQIKILNLETFKNCDGFNIFEYIRTELDIDRVLEAITESTKQGDQKGEDIWIQAEALFLRSLIGFLWFDGQDNGYMPHLGMITDMLRFVERKDPKIPSPVEEWFEELNERRPNNYAYKQWMLFQGYKGETRASVIATANGRYSVFDHEEVINIIREDTMDIDSWNTKKTAVFVVIPETTTIYNFIANLFLTTGMETLRKGADAILTGERVLPEGLRLLEIQWLIDEAANIGKIPNIDKGLATFRSRKMSIVLVLQALDQLKTMYPKGWATLVNTCDTLLFLGGDEKETTEYLSKRAGKQTISVRKQSLSRGSRGSSSENRDKIGRDLLTPSEIGRINGKDALVYIAGQHVFKDKKYTVPDHPNAHLLANSPSDEHWYHYKRYFTEEERLIDLVKRNEAEIIDHGVITDG